MTVVQWQHTDGELKPVLPDDERTVAWAPQPGSQVAFLECPIFEALYEGERGPGKTDALLMSFLQHVGQGYGANWRGILFRRTYPELQDVIDKSQRWFPLVFPSAKYNRSEHFWHFPTKEQLFLRHFEREQDYWKYHGHEYPWIGWEELTTWPDDKGYKKMFSTARSTFKGIPIQIRATTNPYGVGHNWVKARYRLPVPAGDTVGPIIRDSKDQAGNPEPARVAIHGKLTENKILLTADPNYLPRLRAAARNPAELRAWVEGDWNIVAGGMLDDVWDPAIHTVPNVPPHAIPLGWRMDRSYDHGQSKPFSVGFWAESNGEPFKYNGHIYGKVRGDLYRFGEWYGWTGEPNTGIRMRATKIALGIVERECDWGIHGRVRPGPADVNIFDPYEGSDSVASDMRKNGVTWLRADMGPGSRKQGWQQLRKRLDQSRPKQREQPGLFVMTRCTEFIRTVPVLPRDPKDMDDVDTDSEDHIGDEVRYRLRKRNTLVTMENF